MNKLTGNKDVDFMILQKLTDVELGKVCKVNKYVNKLCEDSDFWLNRIVLTFPYLNNNDVIEFKKFFDFETYKELYIFLKTFPVEKEMYFAKKIVERNTVIKLLKNMKLIDAIINETLNKNLPMWINRDLLITTLKRKFPEFILENSGYNTHGYNFVGRIEQYLNSSFLKNFQNNKQYNQFNL